MEKRRFPYLYRFNFFGLTLEYRMYLFKQIHEIVFYGRGGYDYETIYNMPVWLRNTTYNFIANSIEKENKAQEESNQSSTSSKIDFSNPNQAKVTLPSHYVGASKK
jgi:hypothetical protein